MTETEFAPTLGIHHDIEIDTYHAGPGISNSGLGDIAQSPFHFWSRHLDPRRPPRPQTQPQEDGQVAHCAILEPDQFNERYVVGPDVSRATKKWKEFVADNPDKTVIKPDQYARAMHQRDAVWAIPDVAQALSKGRPEVSAYWNDPKTGVLCRCRPDFVHDAGSGVVLVDVKTFSDARPREFGRQCARMNYHRQDAFYSDGYQQATNIEVLGFIFVAVEMPWPHAALPSMLDDDSRAAGAAQYRRALDLYAACLENNLWPSYNEAIELMRLPAWALEDTV